jgi:PAS domain S-box-containing protein
MATDELAKTVARLADAGPLHPIVIQSWQRSLAAGLDRDAPPNFRRVSSDELQRRQSDSRVLLDSAIPHLHWLSRWFEQRPHVAYLVDSDGIVLHAEGDPDAIDRYYLSPGYDWSESLMGTNGAGTALASGVPVAVVGCDHWFVAWKDATCLGAPILGRDGTPIGAIEISLDVQTGDAERIVVAAHVAHTISQELARFEAEARNRATEELYDTVRAALDAEQRARADTEAALARAQAAEAALHESEARLSLALDNSEMGMWELDLGTDHYACSEQTATLVGLQRDQTSGPLTLFLERVHPDDRAAVRHANERAAGAAGAICDLEFRAIWPDGTLHWINGKGRVAGPAGGAGPRLIGICQDVTPRKEAEAALRVSEHWLQTIIDSTPAVVYVVDAAGRFGLVNRNFAELFALGQSAVVGRSLFDYFPADVAAQFIANNQQVMESRSVCEFEEVAPTGDTSRTYLSVKAPLYDDAGTPYAVCGVSSDITERKQLIAALQLAQHQKDAIIATVAHELRQPLGAIRTALALMQKRTSRERGEVARSVVERQIQQLARMVDDLMDAARIAQGKVTLHRKRTTLGGIIDAAVSIVQPMVREREQHLDVEMPADALWLDGDSARLQQVFSNLLTNASKFTGPAGRITVSVEPTPDTIAVRVRDTGQGIAADALPHIFDLFTQAAPDAQGLGIGLALVRELVERHGGKVEAHSEGLGQGSEFVVRLPRAESPAATSAKLPAEHT